MNQFLVDLVSSFGGACEVSFGTEQVPIDKHPCREKPGNDYGVVPARPEEICEDTGDVIPARQEDRSGWVREWDGLSPADISRDFPNDPRNPMLGITHFLRPVIEARPVKEAK